MNSQTRKSHGDKFKLKVALAALKGDKSTAELCQEFAVASSQIYAWKTQLETHGFDIFAKKNVVKHNMDIEKLHNIIGKLFVANEILSRKS